jgi:predicted GNAT superfamily acetyltransferase
MTLREASPADLSELLSLNESSVAVLSELNEPRLHYILALAHRSLVVEREGKVVGFAIAIAPGTKYDSRNYAWFGEHFEQFLYLDRIAVAETARREGLGAQLYDAMEQSAEPFGRMVCDVNVEPPNEASLAFHSGRGYREVGRLAHGSEKTVALLSKELGASG